jgi:hypothetical protein
MSKYWFDERPINVHFQCDCGMNWEKHYGPNARKSPDDESCRWCRKEGVDSCVENAGVLPRPVTIFRPSPKVMKPYRLEEAGSSTFYL